MGSSCTGVALSNHPLGQRAAGLRGEVTAEIRRLNGQEMAAFK